MTENQKSVLTWMRRERIAAVAFEGQYVWREGFEHHPEKADRFLRRGGAGRFETKVIRS